MIFVLSEFKIRIMYEIGNDGPISFKMETYEQKQCCSHCTLNRKGLKSVATSKRRLVRLSYLCAAMSLFISIMALWMCYRLQTRCTADDDIAHLHSVIKQLSQEIKLLQNNQIKVNGDYLINSKSGNADASYFDIEPKFKDESLQGFQRNQTESTVLSQKELQQQMHKIVKRSKNKKHRRNHMSFIQIVGSGSKVHRENKNAVTGFWTLPTWLKKKRLRAARKTFEFNQINRSGKLKVKKKGLYLVYAQFTLVGSPITGFHVSLEHSSSNTEKILQCTQFVNTKSTDGTTPTQSCFTMGIVELKTDQQLFIQESQNNSGANYSNISYFGLVKIGD